MVAGAGVVVAQGVAFLSGFSFDGEAVVGEDVVDGVAAWTAGFLEVCVDLYADVALCFYGACKVEGVRVAVDVADEEYAAEACFGECCPGIGGGCACLFDEVAVGAGSCYAVNVPVGLCLKLDVDGVGWYAVVVDFVAGGEAEGERKRYF